MLPEPSNTECVISFLIADFNDTSEHLRATGRKIEFTFQLYVGFFSLFFTFTVSLITIAPDMISKILPHLTTRLSNGIISGILFVLIALTYWVFEFCLRGSMMNSLYINRMNFLRKEIYEYLGCYTENSGGFLYVSQLLSETKNSKVGMTSLFPYALQIILSFFIFPAFCLFIFFVVFPNIGLEHMNSMIGLSCGLIFYAFLALIPFGILEWRWNNQREESQRMIKNNWNSQTETK